MCEQVQKLQIKKLGKVGNKSSADGWPPQKRGLPGDQPGGRTDLLLLCSLFGCLLGSSFNSITECDAALSSPQASSFGGRSSAEWSILNRSSEGTSGLVNRGNLESNVRLGTKNNTKSSGSQHFIPPPTKLQFFFHSETVNHVLSFPSTCNFIFFFLLGPTQMAASVAAPCFSFFLNFVFPSLLPCFLFSGFLLKTNILSYGCGSCSETRLFERFFYTLRGKSLCEFLNKVSVKSFFSIIWSYIYLPLPLSCHYIQTSNTQSLFSHYLFILFSSLTLFSFFFPQHPDSGLSGLLMSPSASHSP